MRLRHLQTKEWSREFAENLLTGWYDEANAKHWFMDNIILKDSHVENCKRYYRDALHNWSHILKPEHLELIVVGAENYARERGWEVFPRPYLMNAYAQV